MSEVQLSLCVPTFNRATMLGDLLESIAREAGPNDSVEVVISDNCSTDDTADVVNQYRSRLQILYHRQSRNVGITANISQVPSLSTGRFCWILGDDDLLVPGALSTILPLLSEHARIPAIVVGYSYQQQTTRTKHLLPNESVEFQHPVFKELHAPTFVPRWEDTFFASSVPALHTSIVSCIFSRQEWIRACPDVEELAQIEPLTTLESTFPHTLAWASFLVGKPVVFAPAPQVYFFVGAQEWFRPKWGTIMFSFCLELAQVLRNLGAREESVRYYEQLILQHQSLAHVILDSSEYTKRHFSLAWLIKQYGNREVLWQNIGRAFRDRSCPEMFMLLKQIGSSCRKSRGRRRRLFVLTIRESGLWSCRCAKSLIQRALTHLRIRFGCGLHRLRFPFFKWPL